MVIRNVALGPDNRLMDQARQNYETHYPDTVAVYRITFSGVTRDGGQTKIFELLDIVPANYWAVTGREALILQRLDVRGEYTVSLPAYADVNELDELVYTPSRTGRTHHFAVSYVYDSALEQTRRVAVTEYKFG